jgi:hypothetical protein
MNTIKISLFAIALIAFVSSCDPKRNSATVGNTQDTTTKAVGGTRPDTSGNTANQGKDSTGKGNVNPTGSYNQKK